MEQAQHTLAQELAVPMVMLVCTAVLTLIGFLLSYQLSRKDRRDDEQDSRIRHLELSFAAQVGKRPSDTWKVKTPPPQGESSA